MHESPRDQERVTDWALSKKGERATLKVLPIRQERIKGEDMAHQTALQELEVFISRLVDRAHKENDDPLMREAVALDHIREELETHWVQVSSDGDVPTVAQGVALARFLRPHFKDPSHASAFISRGTQGLGRDYLHVRFNDGYEGGIDREGRVST